MNDYIMSVIIPHYRRLWGDYGYEVLTSTKREYITKENTSITLGNTVYILNNATLNLEKSSTLVVLSADNVFVTDDITYDSMTFSKNEVFTNQVKIDCDNYRFNSTNNTNEFIPFVLEFLKLQPIKR